MSVSRLATAALNYLLCGWRNGTVLAATGATNTEPSSTQVTIPSLHRSPFPLLHVSVYPAEQRCTHTDGETEGTG